MFLTMPIFVEMVLPIRTCITVYLIVSLAVDTLERMRARLAFLCCKLWRIHLRALFATLYLLSIMLRFVRSIVFDALGHMQLTTKC